MNIARRLPGCQTALLYGTQAPAPIPEEYRENLGSMVYGCDICQDVCPWNRGVEKRRRGEEASRGAGASVSLAEWLEGDGDELVRRYGRLYVPKNDPRDVARQIVDGIERGDAEVLADDVTRHFKAALSGPAEALRTS